MLSQHITKRTGKSIKMSSASSVIHLMARRKNCSLEMAKRWVDGGYRVKGREGEGERKKRRRRGVGVKEVCTVHSFLLTDLSGAHSFCVKAALYS